MLKNNPALGRKGVKDHRRVEISSHQKRRIFTAVQAAVCCVGCLLLVAAPLEARPKRIVSLNMCVDQILVDLVEKERVAALSFLATDTSMSAVAARAVAYNRVRGEAEEVLALDPDLILVGAFSTPATRNLLQRLGKRVVIVKQPQTIEGVRDLIREVAGLVGAPARGEEIIATFDQRLGQAVAGLSEQASPKPTALAVQVNSIVSPSGTLLDDAMRFVGLNNSARDLTVARSGRVALETIVLNPPDILVLANSPEDFKTVLADNLRHPIIHHLRKSRPVVALPMWATLCGTPYVATAVEKLAAARHNFQTRGHTQ